MKLAYYYHVPISLCDGVINTPSYLGVLVDSIALRVNNLTLLMHEASGVELEHCDYIIKSENVDWLNLGRKTSAWFRMLDHRNILRKKLFKLEVDYLIVRSPSPLAPYFERYFPKHKIRYLVVGDYQSGVSHSFLSIRGFAINWFLKYNNRLFCLALANSHVFVNSEVLFEKYIGISSSCHLVNTSTLSEDDFYMRDDTCCGQVIHLLYTGRIDLQKGLMDLLVVTSELRKLGRNIILNIVGWEDDKDKPVEFLLRRKVEEFGIQDYVKFHGLLKIGKELNSMYRSADIYVIPSFHEGFPRTIWEAMANSLPVVATAVGGIPRLLQSGEHCLLVQPRSPIELALAIQEIIDYPLIRKELISNAIKLASRNTLDISTQQLIFLLREN